MTRAPVKQFTSWSASRLATYQTCPLKAKLTYLDKHPAGQVKSPALERGTRIHKLAEDYVKGGLARLPTELKAFGALFKDLRARRKAEPAAVLVEEEWGFSRTWGYAAWRDWQNCWARVKVDVVARDGDRVEIKDWKTGKFYPGDDKYEQQLDLYGLTTVLTLTAGGKRPWPDLQVVPNLVYLDAGKVHPLPGKETTYGPRDVPRLKKEWYRRVRPMLNDKTFAPRANWSCPYCEFRKDNGGPCKM